MSHARQQIQDEAVSLLDVGVTATVQSERVWITQESELPIVGVYTNTEEMSQDDGTFTAIGRTLELVCELVVQGVDGATVNSSLNAIAVEVETVLGANREMLGVLDVVPQAWDVEQNTEGDTVTGKGVMVFEVLYRTAIGAPETII
jgi:thiamine biosynthesis protein ThiC